MAHANIDHDEWEMLLVKYLPAAVENFENDTHRTAIRRAHRWVLDRFPYSPGHIRLPRGKTTSVESIAYSLNGETVLLTGPSLSPSGSDFQEDLNGEDGGVIMPPRGQSWPSADSDVPAPVVIAFNAGYDWSDLPFGILQAILFKATDHVEFRGTADIPRNQDVNQRAWDRLISPYVLTRTYGICD